MRTEFLCVSVLRVASGPRVELAGCRGALSPPVVYSTDRSRAVVPVLVLLFVALWFILRGDLLYVFPCVILFLCFSSFWYCDYLAWGREGWSWCFSCVCSVCACLGLSVSSSSWGLGAAVCDCGTPWAFLLPFFQHIELRRDEKYTICSRQRSSCWSLWCLLVIWHGGYCSLNSDANSIFSAWNWWPWHTKPIVFKQFFVSRICIRQVHQCHQVHGYISRVVDVIIREEHWTQCIQSCNMQIKVVFFRSSDKCQYYLIFFHVSHRFTISAIQNFWLNLSYFSK